MIDNQNEPKLTLSLDLCLTGHEVEKEGIDHK